MWNIRTFKTREAMNKWLARHAARIQWNEIFINNGFALEYRKLRRVY